MEPDHIATIQSVIDQITTNSRELSLVVTKLQEAQHWLRADEENRS